MTHEPFDTQAAAYALGALDAEERTEFERHLATGCDLCQASLRESGEALAALAAHLPPALPPAGVRAALLRRIETDAASRPSIAPSRRRWLGWAATAAAAVVVGALANGLILTNRYEARVAQLAGEVASLRAERAQAQAVLDLLRDPATRLVVLQGAEPSPGALARVIWHETAGGWIMVAKLPPAQAGKTYELWTFSGGRPSPAGVFDVDASGSATVPIKATGGPVEGFAVTLEPAGGVPSPTGPIVLAAR
jgi:anti-sigma-K factor RskA